MSPSSRFLFVLLFLPVVAFTQSAVKVNITALYDEVPTPPRNVQEAYSRALCTINGDTYYCDSKKYFSVINDKAAAISLQIEKLSAQLALPSTAVAGNVDPKEMERKMATMSQAEKMKFAMAMMQEMNLGPKTLAPEPVEVQEAVQEYHRLNQLVAKELQNAGAIQEENGRLYRERDAKHRAIETSAAAEIEKLPYVDFSEAGKFKDAKAVYAIQAKAIEKHIAAENEYLTAVQKQWNNLKAGRKERYRALQQKLAAAEYGEVARNVETKRTLIGAQQLMTGPIQELLTLSQNSTDEAVDWWTRKLRFDQQMKP